WAVQPATVSPLVRSMCSALEVKFSQFRDNEGPGGALVIVSGERTPCRNLRRKRRRILAPLLSGNGAGRMASRTAQYPEKTINPRQRSCTMSRREFHYQEGNSQKFWAIDVAGSRFTVQFGRLGTAGQTQTKEFGSDQEAQKAADKLIAEKTKKGY